MGPVSNFNSQGSQYPSRPQSQFPSRSISLYPSRSISQYPSRTQSFSSLADPYVGGTSLNLKPLRSLSSQVRIRVCNLFRIDLATEMSHGALLKAVKNTKQLKTCEILGRNLS